jgi:Kdo2-lipid IVA lauroyltransferase/acyltransferase
MIVFSGHIANWEIGMLAGVQHGISVAQIYRAANNPLMDRMIARFRGDQGEFIPKGAVAARRAITALRRGMHLGLLADQNMNDGIPVPFFGRPAMTAPALAVLALRFDCDVLPLRSSGSMAPAFGSRSSRRCPCRAAMNLVLTRQR